jgi:putative ABC transport system permease protein
MRAAEVWRVTWRNLFARKLRLLLSAFAIVLGVAFVAGSMIFTHAMGGAFDNIIEGSTSDVEVAFKGANDFDSGQDSRTFPASVVSELERLPEVASAHAQNTLQSVFVIGKNGKVIGGNGPPGLAVNPTQAESLTGKPILTLTRGRYPTGPDEIALDVDTAEKGDFTIGDEVKLATTARPPVMRARVTGLVEFGSGGLNGATMTVFDSRAMQQRFFGGRNVFTSVSLDAAPGVSQAQLARAAQQVLPDGVVARTGDAIVKKNKESLDKILGFLQTFLLVFALVSLVVGVFIILNTFSILVAQRSRELALLRAMGASRRQVNGAVLLEAAVVGLVGSTVGLAVGYLLALGLRWLFGVFGLDLSRADFPLTWQAVISSYVVGVVVTAVAALIPARRASRIPPMAALRDDVALPESSLRRRVVGGSVLVVLGALAIAVGLAGQGNTSLISIGGGILLVLVGVAMMSAFLGQPVLHLFGALYRRTFGAVGRMAAQNALRNPRRTGATASALMIGLALMTMMSIFGSSASASTDAAIGKSLTSQFIVSNVVGQPFSTDVAEQIRRLDGVSGVAELRNAYPELKGGGNAWTVGVDPRAFGLAFAVPAVAGSFARLGPGTVAISETQAREKGFGVGDTVTMKFQARELELRVVALFPSNPVVPGDYVVTPDTLAKGGLTPLDAMVMVTKKPSASTDAVRSGIEKVVKDLPTVTVKDPEGFAAEQKTQVNQFLYLIYGLLGLSVIIAILGVINTLSLSVIERTREVGLLRAVGLSRRQLRTMIRLESIVVAVLGGVLGALMGVIFGATMVSALRDDGLTDLAVPWAWVAGFLVLAAVAGVLAAVVPARRAARLDVLEAIGTE